MKTWRPLGGTRTNALSLHDGSTFVERLVYNIGQPHRDWCSLLIVFVTLFQKNVLSATLWSPTSSTLVLERILPPAPKQRAKTNVPRIQTASAMASIPTPIQVCVQVQKTKTCFVALKMFATVAMEAALQQSTQRRLPDCSISQP